jgi:hypothetical protein
VAVPAFDPLQLGSFLLGRLKTFGKAGEDTVGDVCFENNGNQLPCGQGGGSLVTSAAERFGGSLCRFGP